MIFLKCRLNFNVVINLKPTNGHCNTMQLERLDGSTAIDSSATAPEIFILYTFHNRCVWFRIGEFKTTSVWIEILMRRAHWININHDLLFHQIRVVLSLILWHWYSKRQRDVSVVKNKQTKGCWTMAALGDGAQGLGFQSMPFNCIDWKICLGPLVTIAN